MTAEEIAKKYGGTIVGGSTSPQSPTPTTPITTPTTTPSSGNSSDIVKKYGGVSMDENPLFNKLQDAPPEQKSGIWSAIQHYGSQAMDSLKNLGIGAAKGLGETAKFAQSLVPPEVSLYNLPSVKAIGAKNPLDSLNTKPEGTAQNVGFGAEQLAEVLVPGGAAAREAKIGAKVAETIGPKVAKVAETIHRPLTVDELVGKVTQGTAKQIQEAKAALSIVDTSGVKTFKDFTAASKKKIGELVTAQDKVLAQYPEKKPLASLEVVHTVGNATVKQNFVRDALTQMGEFYNTTKNVKELAKTKDLAIRAEKEGLNATEVNNIARQYNTDFAAKAFNPKTGDPLTSTSKIGMENTRKGLKETATNIVPDKAYRAIDESLANVYTLRDTSDQMEKAVLNLQNKVKERGLLEKAGGALATGLDWASLGSVKGFVAKLLPSNVGLKTMNSIDIQNSLAKNLKKIKDLADHGSDKEVLDFMKSIGEGK